MRVAVPNLPPVDLGITETTPTVSITDFSRRVTDDFGVTSVVRRGFARRMSLRIALPFDQVAALQSRLADLRATKATWIADDRFRALSVLGIYKDFDIDVAAQPQSYCTLTIDGLAETLDYPDTGGDPAVSGVSTFRLLQPVTVTDTVLRGSSVPEGDHPAWSSSTTYAKGSRVVVGHRIYESTVADNLGNDPATATQWLDAAPTNRWAMFDQALGSETTTSGSIVVTLAAVNATALALLDVTGATVRVQGAGYDQQRSTGGAMVFGDLPAGDITVTITGAGTVAVGTLLFGRIVALGTTEENPSAGITDFSRKQTDDFGDVTIVARAWSKRMTARTLFRTDALDLVFDRIATVRAVPSLWIGDDDTDALTIYGFFKDFSIEVGETTSKLSLQIEGLSKAAKVKPFGDSGPVQWDSIVGAGKPEDNATRGMTAAERLKYDGIADDIADIFSDGILHRGPEKLTLLRIYDDLIADSTAAHAQSVALDNQYGGDPTLAERVARDTAINALITYLNGLAPPWSQVDVDTPANGYDIRDRFGAVRQATADLARANDSFVAARAKAALDQLVAIGSDSVLSRGEKPAVLTQWQTLYAESVALKARWQALGSPVAVKAAIDAQDAAVSALSDYLVSLAPGWSDATQDTPIDPATWQLRWQQAYASLSASRSALYAYTATTAQWDGVGNKPYSRLFANMLDLQPFVPGAVDSFGRFAQNGGNGQNAVVLTSGPADISEPVLRMVANPGQGDVGGDNAGSPCGGWNYTLFADRGEYDPRKTYRFMNWAFQSPGASGALYLGTGPTIDLLDGTPNGNFYFWDGMLPEAGKWFLIVGVLHGSDYRDGQSGVSGVYDPETGRRVLPGSDCRSQPSATTLTHRAYQFYAQQGSTAWFARPSVEEVTSATISVEQIFATVGMTSVQAAALATAQNAIDAIGSDAVLSKGEKDSVIREYVALSKDVDALGAKYASLGYPSDITAQVAAMITARDNLGGYLNTLSPPWADQTQDSPIDPPTWANRWDVAYDRLAMARAAITGRKGDKGDKGDKGEGALTAYLTNENFSQPTNSAGFPVEIAGGIGDGQMRVLYGAQDVTGQCSFTAQLPYNLALTVDQAGNYSSSHLYADQGYAFVIATYQGQAISKRVTASRSKGGADGTAPPLLTIQASSQAIVTNADGSLVTNGAITFTAARQNTAQPVAWGVYDGAGAQHRHYDGVSFTTDAADLLAIINYPGAIGQANTRFCTIRAACGGVDDFVTVWAVRNGAPGQNGVSPLSLELGAAAMVVAATYAGATKAGQVPRDVRVTLKQGLVDAIGAYTIGVTTSANVSASYANGVLTVTRADGDGYVEVTANQGGTVVAGPKRLAVTRNIDPAPPQSATGLSTVHATGDPQATTYQSGPTTAILTLQAPANGVLPIEIYATYGCAQNFNGSAPRNYTLGMKIMYRVAGSGSAWSDLTGEFIGTAATWYSNGEGEPGDISASTTVSIGGGATYEFGAMQRKYAGNGQASYLDKTIRIGT